MRRRQKPFESHLLDRTTGVDKPWLSGPSSKPHRLSYFLFLFGIVVGVGAGGYLIYSGYAEVPRDSYCQVLSEDFSNGVDTNFWQKEVVMGGTNVDDFTWFTDSDTNIFTSDNKLHLLPTFTSDSEGDDLTASVDLGDACTSDSQEDCSASGNDDEIIPPIQSGMISTRGKVGIKYGRVEIRAKMPTGDWLWPRISLVPLDNVYGSYPASGQIDIFLTRGNIAKKRTDQFNNEMSAGLHFGPDPTTDRFSLAQGIYKLYRLFFNDQFYTFGVDWNEDQVFIWINTRVRKVLNLNFQKQTFFQRGKFPAAFSNGSLINDPWALSETPFIAPFDQTFYLRMSVAAGGTDGFWSDDLSKPWKNENRRGVAQKSFWEKRDDWFPSWPSGDSINDRAVIVDSVKMWQKGSCQ
ncbi:concanavalin A-like lectin/glucanase domain-containing protein [Mrakia frigida]|uniref:concanavalin A-like lectin/glucanase domain-containing protein n=1 Tax=Mrakia frigida TaxID=29902 RepID=UPI003FCBF6AB